MRREKQRFPFTILVPGPVAVSAVRFPPLHPPAVLQQVLMLFIVSGKYNPIGRFIAPLEHPCIHFGGDGG